MTLRFVDLYTNDKIELILEIYSFSGYHLKKIIRTFVNPPPGVLYVLTIQLLNIG